MFPSAVASCPEPPANHPQPRQHAGWGVGTGPGPGAQPAAHIPPQGPWASLSSCDDSTARIGTPGHSGLPPSLPLRGGWISGPSSLSHFPFFIQRRAPGCLSDCRARRGPIHGELMIYLVDVTKCRRPCDRAHADPGSPESQDWVGRVGGGLGKTPSSGPELRLSHQRGQGTGMGAGAHRQAWRGERDATIFTATSEALSERAGRPRHARNTSTKIKSGKRFQKNKQQIINHLDDRRALPTLNRGAGGAGLRLRS